MPQPPDSSLRDLALSWSIYSFPTHGIFDLLMPWAFKKSCGICWQCSKTSRLLRMRHKMQTLREQEPIGIYSHCNLQYVHLSSDTNTTQSVFRKCFRLSSRNRCLASKSTNQCSIFNVELIKRLAIKELHKPQTRIIICI